MPRAPNPKCQQCARLTREAAIAQHGPDGDGCWDTRRCPDRRYKYRTAPIVNQVRRQQRRQRQATTEPGQDNGRAVSLDLERLDIATPHAYVYWFRRTKDAPVHAVGAQLWIGDHLRAKTYFHVTGGGAVQIKAQLLHVLEQFSEITGVRVPHYRDEIELMPECCPLRPCPLHPEL